MFRPFFYIFRFLATGDSFTTIAFSFRVGESTVSKIVHETCEVLWDRLQPLFMPIPTVQQWEDIANGFETRWQFPNCLGAIDGKHVVMFAPRNSGSKFFNYKKTFSTVLLGLVDHRYCFVVVDIGAYGSNSDSGIFKNSVLGRRFADNALDFPNDKPLPGVLDEADMPHVIVGDEAFPLGRNLLRPFPGKNLTDDERIFNYRLSRARRISENAFGILANRWRLYHRKMPLQASGMDKVVKATCVLHNMLETKGVPVPPPPEPEVTDGSSKTKDNGIHGGIFRQMGKLGGRPPVEGIVVRTAFKRYFVSDAGSVPWQRAYCFGTAN